MSPHRRLAAPVLGVLIASGLVSQAVAAVHVPVNQARRVAIRASAGDVIIGNPAIADVSVLDGRTIYLIGKSTGVTNLVILDQAGRTIFSDTVIVGNANMGAGRTPEMVSITRGRTVQDIACSPRCADMPTVVTGNRIPPPDLAPAPSPLELPAAPSGASSAGSTASTGSTPR